MKRVLSYFIIFFNCYFSVKAQNNTYIPKYSTILKMEQIKLVVQNGNGYWQPEQADIELLEKNFKKLKRLAPVGDPAGYKIKDIDGYAYQYTGVIIENKKYVYINAFNVSRKKGISELHKEWKPEPIECTADGGTGYFRVLFSLEDYEFSRLIFNGMG